MNARHEILGGKVQIYRRSNSPFWQCSASVGGQQHRTSTKQEGLAQAKDYAEDWFLELKGMVKFGGGFPTGRTFKESAEKFMAEYEVITHGERSPRYVEMHKVRIKAHLMPFFGNKRINEVTPGLVQDYHVHRMTSRIDPNTGEPKRPAKNTLHQEIVTLRQILKTANRHGWIDHVPNLSAPYQSSSKVSHRGWFSPNEYKQLYTATRNRIQNPKRRGWKPRYELLHDFVLFMANTGLRPDEAFNLEFRDVTIVTDESADERILEIEVRGKRGVGYCMSMPGAVMPFERLRNRAKPAPSDKLFPHYPRELFNKILEEEGLRIDRDGRRRTAYSLRHTYICLRLMEGADIYQIAKNCRTSVEMIEKYYASHLANTLDTASINIRKPKTNVIRENITDI